MSIDDSYFTNDLYIVLDARLKQLIYYAEHDKKDLCTAKLAKTSLEILESLRRECLPVLDLYNFRKKIVVEFHKSTNTDINPNAPLSVDLYNTGMPCDDQLPVLACEYHDRLWRCLKLVLSEMSSSFRLIDPVRVNISRAIDYYLEDK